ncbi:MAG TPA: DUF87 domain-containing protein [Acidobacteriota bacterium]|jgi:hypothetical protein
MSKIVEKFIAGIWNRSATEGEPQVVIRGLDLGLSIVDGQLTRSHTGIPHSKRPEHVAILGKTGTGKSSLLRYMARQDIGRDQGFCFFDLHGDATSVLLGLVASEERRSSRDLSEKLVIIEPADREFSVGLNVLEETGLQSSFVQIAEFAQILKQRWHLDALGARTEELLRNALAVALDNNLTLLEVAPLLTNQAFRAACLRRTANPEIKDYFEGRYNRASEGMQATTNNAILNKLTAFTADPHFRHILGQRQSTFSLLDALDHGCWVVVNLDKGRLGEQAATLGSLLLTKLKNALFSRRSRNLFTIYADEIQNLVTFDSGLDVLLSEARKFGISVCSANQYLDQYPQQMRAAIMAVGTHVCFQLSAADADKLGAAFDGGKTLAEILKNLPQRHIVIKSGHHRWRQAVVPQIEIPQVDWRDLYNRCRHRWARRRTEIDAEIRARQQRFSRQDEVLDDWE